MAKQIPQGSRKSSNWVLALAVIAIGAIAAMVLVPTPLGDAPPAEVAEAGPEPALPTAPPPPEESEPASSGT
jgi:hypothetical protein